MYLDVPSQTKLLKIQNILYLIFWFIGGLKQLRFILEYMLKKLCLMLSILLDMSFYSSLI